MRCGARIPIAVLASKSGLFPPLHASSVCSRAVGNKLEQALSLPSGLEDRGRKSPVGPWVRHHPFQGAVFPHEASLDQAGLWVSSLLHHCLLWDPYTSLLSTCRLGGPPPGPDRINGGVVWLSISSLSPCLCSASEVGKAGASGPWCTGAMLLDWG